MGSFRNIVPIMVLVACMGLSQISVAQETAPKSEEQEPEKPKIKTLPPAYDNQMMRLSEVLGALHYLRNLCGANEGLLWRDQMANIIENEEPTQERKAEMTARFNRGYRSFQETYRACTPVAVEAVNAYLREGKKLSGEIPSRFGR